MTLGNNNGTDGQTDGQTECDAICGPLLKEEGRIKAPRETQTLRAAYAGAVRPTSLYRIWSGLLNSFKSY